MREAKDFQKKNSRSHFLMEEKGQKKRVVPCTGN